MRETENRLEALAGDGLPLLKTPTRQNNPIEVGSEPAHIEKSWIETVG
jgi:hypothetical protein